MKCSDLLRHLRAMSACSDAIEWVECMPGKLTDLWATCHRGDWMLWLAARSGSVTRDHLAMNSAGVIPPDVSLLDMTAIIAERRGIAKGKMRKTEPGARNPELGEEKAEGRLTSLPSTGLSSSLSLRAEGRIYDTAAEDDYEYDYDYDWAPRSHGPTVSRSSGLTVPRSHGPTIPRSSGPPVPAESSVRKVFDMPRGGNYPAGLYLPIRARTTGTRGRLVALARGPGISGERT